MKLTIQGNPFLETGYGRHTACLALALDELEVDVAIEAGFLSSQPPEGRLKELASKSYPYAPTLMITTPDWWRIKMGDRIKPLVGFGVFEGDRIPLSWARAADEPELTSVFVPSRHVEQAFRNAGVKKEITVVPHGVDLGKFKPQELPKEPDAPFKFLFVGGWREGVKDRKGLDILLRAFCAEFKPGEKVQLDVKINTAYSSAMQVKQMVDDLKLPAVESRPPVYLFFDQLNDDRMRALYQDHDVLVQPSKAEGFLLPALEAMACGVPVITTNYGGQTDFVNDDNGFLLKELEMVQATGSPVEYYRQAKWAIPSQVELQEKLRFVFEMQGEVERRRVLARLEAEKYSWKNAARIVKERFEVLA